MISSYFVTGFTRAHLGASTTRDLLMTNWFVLEVIIRMRVAGVWEFFSNDQWMWNLVRTQSLGVRELLTWNTHGTRMNADLYEDVFFLKLKYGHFHPCHYKCKCIRHLIFFDLTFSQHFVNYLYIPTWNQRVFVLGQEFTFPETNMFLPI